MVQAAAYKNTLLCSNLIHVRHRHDVYGQLIVADLAAEPMLSGPKARPRNKRVSASKDAPPQAPVFITGFSARALFRVSYAVSEHRMVERGDSRCPPRHPSGAIP
jgi:hypothetical protein